MKTKALFCLLLVSCLVFQAQSWSWNDIYHSAIGVFKPKVQYHELWERCPRCEVRPGPKTIQPSRPHKLVTINLADNSALYAFRHIGTPPQRVKLNFDTGGFHSWFVKPNTHGFTDNREILFELGKSKSSKQVGNHDTFDYGKGKLSGHKYYDHLQINQAVTLKNHFFMYADKSTINHVHFTGSVGLRPCKGEVKFLHTLKLQGHINHEEFSLYLPSDEKSHHKPQLILGGINTQLIQSHFQFHYFNLPDPTQWALRASHFHIGDYYMKTTAGTAKTLELTFDSGSNQIVISRAVANFMGNIMPLSDGKKYKKSVMGIIPTLHFQISKKTILKVYPDQYMDCNSSYCVYQISVNDKLVHNEVILGLPFLRGYYTHFDAENRRIGFAHGVGMTYHNNKAGKII